MKQIILLFSLLVISLPKLVVAQVVTPSVYYTISGSLCDPGPADNDCDVRVNIFMSDYINTNQTLDQLKNNDFLGYVIKKSGPRDATTGQLKPGWNCKENNPNNAKIAGVFLPPDPRSEAQLPYEPTGGAVYVDDTVTWGDCYVYFIQAFNRLDEGSPVVRLEVPVQISLCSSKDEMTQGKLTMSLMDQFIPKVFAKSATSDYLNCPTEASSWVVLVGSTVVAAMSVWALLFMKTGRLFPIRISKLLSRKRQ